MKTVFKVILFYFTILSAQNIEAQSVMLKGTAFFFPTDVGGFGVLEAQRIIALVGTGKGKP